MKLKLSIICFYGNAVLLAQTSSKTSSLENWTNHRKIIDKQTSEPLEYVNIVVRRRRKVLTGEIPQRKDFYH
jgi:hypothetical protein